MNTQRAAGLQERAVRREVIRGLPHFWAYMALSTLLFLLIQLIALLPSLLMERVVDLYIPQKDLRGILWSILLFCLLPLLATALTTAYRYGLAMVCRRLGLQLAIRGFENLLSQPVAYFDQENSAQLAAHCRKESLQYITFWMMDVPQLLATGLAALALLGLLGRLHWSLPLWLLCYFPLAYFPSNGFAKRVQHLMEQIVQNNAAMNQLIGDSFRGIKTVKSMTLEETQSQKLRAVNEKSVRIWSRVALFDNLSGIWINDFSDALLSGGAFGLAAFLTVLGRLTLGNIVLVLGYSSRFLGMAKGFLQSNYNFKEKLGEYQKLFEILTMERPQDGGRDFAFERELRFSGVSFAYDPQRGNILQDLDLSVKAGEWLGVVGPSGAGKSTLFDLLLRFYEPQAGVISADGVDLRQLSARSIRRSVAYISQDSFLFPGSLRDNLLLADPKASDQRLCQVLEQVRLGELLGRLPQGLDTPIGEGGALLSGGERQKLGLALGLLRGCKLLLLDEVTANIDPAGEEEIRSLLRQLKEQQGLTLLSVSHRPAFLKDCDRIVLLREGKIQAESSYEAYIRSLEQ